MRSRNPSDVFHVGFLERKPYVKKKPKAFDNKEYQKGFLDGALFMAVLIGAMGVLLILALH